MTKSFDIEIHGNIVNRERAQYGDATQMAAVRELVDNCVDAGATMVEITFDSVNSTITIKDDGCGCSDMNRFFDFGGTSKRESSATNIGRYGIGGTWAGLFLSDTQEVFSIERTERILRHASMPWTDAANGTGPLRWKLHSQRKAKDNEQHGTKVVLRGIRRGMADRGTGVFSPPQQRSLTDTLRKTYGQAIAQFGLLITINDELLEPVPPPEMVGNSHELIITRQWRGLSYTLRARHINQDDQHWVKGVYMAYRGRMLNGNAKPWITGMGEFAAAPVWIWIELIDTATARWPLAWNKSDIEDRGAVLDAAISDDGEVQAFLRDVDMRAQDIDSTLLGEGLSGLTNEVLGPLARVLEKRPGDGGASGTVVPIASGLTRRKATVVDPEQDGGIDEVKREREHESWRVVLRDMGAQGPMYSVYIDASKRKRHGEIVDTRFKATVEFNVWSDAQRARLRDKSVAFMLIAQAVSDGLRREHTDLFMQLYRGVIGVQPAELFPKPEDAQRLAHALICRFDQRAALATGGKKKKA